MEQYLFENLLLLLLMLFIYVNEIIFLSIAVVEAMSFDFFFRAKLHRICARLSTFLTLLMGIACCVLRKLQLQATRQKLSVDSKNVISSNVIKIKSPGNKKIVLWRNFKCQSFLQFIYIQLYNKVFMKLELLLLQSKRLCFMFKDAQLSGQRLALGNQRFPIRVRLLPMCRGELSAIIAQLMCKCL